MTPANAWALLLLHLEALSKNKFVPAIYCSQKLWPKMECGGVFEASNFCEALSGGKIQPQAYSPVKISRLTK